MMARPWVEVLSYCYDALDRLTAKAYTQQTCTNNTLPSPIATYSYDVASVDGFSSTNPVGRLVKTATTGTYPTATYFSYNPMGRILNQGQCVGINNCGTSAPSLWVASNSYDLMGDLTSYTDANGVTFTQSPVDGAGRPTQLTSSWVDATHPDNLVTTVPTTAYYPNGVVHTLTLGNGLTETAAYNSRLQACELNLNSVAMSLAACNTPLLSSGNVQDFTYSHHEGTTNNGNVAMWVANGQQSFSRSYTYDKLNRLWTYADNGATQPCKGLTWTYDAWGNRTDQTGTAGTCDTFHASVTATNHLLDPLNNIYQYDAAGNITFDGNHHYSFDAENHLTSVDSGTTLYVYDASGQRVAKAAGSALTKFYIYGPSGHGLYVSRPSRLHSPRHSEQPVRLRRHGLSPLRRTNLRRHHHQPQIYQPRTRPPIRIRPRQLRRKIPRQLDRQVHVARLDPRSRWGTVRGH